MSERDRRYRQGKAYAAKLADAEWRDKRNARARAWRKSPRGRAWMERKAARRRRETAAGGQEAERGVS